METKTLWIIKLDGRRQKYKREKLIKSLEQTFITTDIELSDYTNDKINKIADYVEDQIKDKSKVSAEEISGLVEKGLMNLKGDYKTVAKQYILYRDERTRMRGNTTDKTVNEIVNGTSDYWTSENSNKNAMLASTQRDYLAGCISEDISRRQLLPTDVVKAHDEGIIHMHDIDYFVQKIHNCCLVNLEDMLQNGTVINGTLIEKPHSFSTACNIATQIMACIASGQHGGQTMSLAHLAPFIDTSRRKIWKEVEEELEETNPSEELINKIVTRRLKEEVKRGVQTMQYQINTLNTSNGQTPFCSLFMYLNEAKSKQEKDDLAMFIAEVLNQRIQGTKNKVGVYVTPSFPKLLYVLEEDNITEDSEYWWLTELAAKCTAKRMVPDYISEKVMIELKGYCFSCMGCRSFLTPDEWSDKLGNISHSKTFDEHKGQISYGRFNSGVVTLNLVDLGLSADHDLDKFWKLFEERTELCHKALKCRHERLRGTKSDISPIHWQYGGLARLEPGETIDELLFNNYSTLSLGYAGLWECVLAVIGKKLTTPEGKELGLQIMQALNDKCEQWKKAENIGYSLYGSPIESTTFKMAKCLKRRFGVIEGITDKDYITNSYHIHVTEPVDAFEKLAFEAEFQKLSPGGAISYIECPNMEKNTEAVLEVIKFIYDTIMYAELNIKSDYCMNCGFDGEILYKEDENGKKDWECPNCGCRDHRKLNIARRTCGLVI